MTYRPIPAVGLAAAVLQMLDFSISVLRKDNTIFQPAGGTPVENPQLLQAIADNLFRLTDAIDTAELRKLQDGAAKGKLSEPALLLLKLSDETKEATTSLLDAVLAAQARGAYGDPRWGTAREALLNGVWKQKDVTGLKKKLRSTRRDVDVALLLALRQYLDQSAETGLPVFSEEGHHMQYWEKWQNAALDAVHSNTWKPKNKKHVEEFSKLVDTLIQSANEAHFCDEMFARLHFAELDHRFNSIPEPPAPSFEWLFDDAQREPGGLLNWLGSTRGDNLFWVTGSPGSGKTGAMKYLFRNPRVFENLEAWSGHAPGITAAFFFWNCGAPLQRSGVGLLRCLLYEALQDMIYGPLEQDMGIVQLLFEERWNQFTTYGGGLGELTFAELRRTFEQLISDATKKFLFVVDGLDEFGDSPVDLLDVVPMLRAATARDNVKVCVSSRMSPAFQEAFEKRPRLVLDEHNGSDIRAFIKHAFNQEDACARLANTDHAVTHYIETTLAEKAGGNFLWVTLATSFLIYGLPDDSVSLESRADALPMDTEPLISHILSSFNTSDVETLWKVSALIEDHPYPGLLPLWHALHADASSTLAADTQPLDNSKIAAKLSAMHDLLTHKCRSFFSVFDVASPDTTRTSTSTYPDPANYRVTYTHRLLRDHLLSPVTKKRSPLAQDYTTTPAWSNAHLLTLKTLSPAAPIWPPLASALECALALFAKSGTLPLTYMDAALDTALEHHHNTNRTTQSDLPCFPPAHPLATSLDLAMLLHLPGYVALKLPRAQRKGVRCALEFSRGMRRRVGVGGEARWIAGPGRERLREGFARVRTETENLGEYYAKAVRFGTPKPFVEVPAFS